MPVVQRRQLALQLRPDEVYDVPRQPLQAVLISHPPSHRVQLQHSHHFAASTNTRDSTTRTPTVSPNHHATQLAPRSAGNTVPRASRPPNDRVALVTQQTGDRIRNRATSISSG